MGNYRFVIFFYRSEFSSSCYPQLTSTTKNLGISEYNDLLKDHSRYKYNSHKYLRSEEQLLYCIQKVFMLRRLSLYLNGANLSICDDLNHCHKYSQNDEQIETEIW